MDEVLGLTFGFDGQPISLRAWVELQADPARIIAQTVVSTDVHVSTIWTGLDAAYHRVFSPESPPLVYETMVFVDFKGTREKHWPTREAALAGHDRIVAEMKAEMEQTLPERPETL
jgi:hypothetical protein